MKLLVLTTMLIALASPAHADWVKARVASPAKIAEAECELAASGTHRGVVAYGNPNYVAGAMIGNAIGNMIRQSMFIDQCMRAQGYEKTKTKTKKRKKLSVNDY